MRFKLIAWPAVAIGIIESFAGCPGSTNEPRQSTDASESGFETEGGTIASNLPNAALDAATSDGADGSSAGVDGGDRAATIDANGVELGMDAGDRAVAIDSGSDDSGADASDGGDANDPLNFPPKCSSGVTWNGVTKDQNMRPGEVCPTCHSNFDLAGTLYPTGHEPNDCDGVDGLLTAATVVVTDATGNVITLYPNAVGNFYTSITITPPFHAKVVLNGQERAMTDSQTTGACNGCHTQTGANGAPGRITLPP